jgi:hypothetical protein
VHCAAPVERTKFKSPTLKTRGQGTHKIKGWRRGDPPVSVERSKFKSPTRRRGREGSFGYAQDKWGTLQTFSAI